MIKRLRRTKINKNIRDSLANCNINTINLVQPIFVYDDKLPINGKTFPEHTYALSELNEKAKSWRVGGINLYPLIPVQKKSLTSDYALSDENILYRAISTIKNSNPDLPVYPDIALDPYMVHGHDGVLNENNNIENDLSIEILAKMSVLAAKSGADFVAPSDMFDGRTQAIRDNLDKEGFDYTGIISYSAKFSSSLYGPFRQNLNNHQNIDKSSYQSDYRNFKSAMLKIQQDIAEGTDIAMIKPALSNLDIISEARNKYDVPLAAFQVSGEYFWIKLGAQKGFYSEKDCVIETLSSIRRAGADIIFTYYADIFHQFID